MAEKTAKRPGNQQFVQGNVAAANAALNAGATHFFGYPITPSSEILETWIQLVGNLEKPNNSPVTKDKLNYLQCEDEMASGFAMIGACLAGHKAFTATAGPGNILMQDAFAAAEAMRIPTVALIVQRGGLSTSTVIYSQEEVTLTCFGGNGEGFRIVYSPSTPQEFYDYTIKAFNSSWEFRYPTFVLADGYLGKMETNVEYNQMDKQEYVKPEPILLKPGEITNIRNCYDQEEEIHEIIEKYRKDYENDTPVIAESEAYQVRDAEIVLIAHGIVATAVKEAVDTLREQGIKVGLWRPITLRPIDERGLLKSLKNARKLIYIESALGQMARLINDVLMYNNVNIQVETLFRPAIGIEPEIIIKKVKEVHG